MPPIHLRTSALTELTDPAPEAASPVVVPLPRGRALSVESGPEAARVSIFDANGAELQIQIRFEAAGPCVSLRAHSLALEATENIVARCETFTLEARQKIELQSGGELIQRAAGNALLAARSVQLEAEAGDVRLRAKLDVQVLGQMILLNCDGPKSLPACVQHGACGELAPIAPEQPAE
jgi:hypothetical protein